MSWLDQISNNLDIVTGDGTRFSPNWLNATKTKEYNTSEFEFVGTKGTLVSRGTPKGNKYNLEIYFQGDDHLDFATAFDEAADDPRPWTLTHPFYGRILAQPLSLAIDNTGYNLSKITIPIIETIDILNPQIEIDRVTRVRTISLNFQQNLRTVFEIKTPSVLDIPKLQNDITRVYNEGKKRIKLTTDASEYFNVYNRAYSAIANMIGEPLAAVNEIQAMINAPVNFVDGVRARVEMLNAQFNALNDPLNRAVTVFDKFRYEQNAGAIVNAMCESAVTEIDYRNRREVIFIMELILAIFNQYLENLDSIQGNDGGTPNSFIPDQSSQVELSRLVNYTISNLFLIANDVKIERTIFLEKDSNVVLVAHRLYGLDDADASIQRIIDDNNIGLNELLQIRKGRAIVYTV